MLKKQVKSVIYQKVMDLRRRLGGWCWAESWLRAGNYFRLGAEGLCRGTETLNRGLGTKSLLWGLGTKRLLWGLWAKCLLLGHWAERLLLLDRAKILDRWRGWLRRGLWTWPVWHYSYKPVVKLNDGKLVPECFLWRCTKRLRDGFKGRLCRCKRRLCIALRSDRTLLAVHARNSWHFAQDRI